MARVALASAVRPLSTPITTPALLVGARQASAALSTSARRLADAPTAGGEAGGKKTGFLSGLLHGSAAAKDLGDHTESHSTSVARGKYVHEIVAHHVHPGKLREYREAVAEFCTWAHEGPFDCRLVGSWECIVGELDTFIHIWEYDGYSGFDRAHPAIRESAEWAKYESTVLPLVASRSSRICQEFAFWPTAEPSVSEGQPIFEMRTYNLKPGSLLEWETSWREGLKARRKFVEPVGAWFSQVGKLHTVAHLWRYESMQNRKDLRDKAWSVDVWGSTVAKTVKLCDSMQANILRALPFSPRR